MKDVVTLTEADAGELLTLQRAAYVTQAQTHDAMLPLTLRSGWATLHGQNLMDTPYAPAPGLLHWLDVAMDEGGAPSRRPPPPIDGRAGGATDPLRQVVTSCAT